MCITFSVGIKGIFRFFRNKKNSFYKKSFGVFFLFLFILLIDNLLGFSFYYPINQKIGPLTNIAILKNNYAGNDEILTKIDIIEKKIINRKNVLEKIEEKLNVINESSANRSRSKLWHTLSSSIILIIVGLILFNDLFLGIKVGNFWWQAIPEFLFVFLFLFPIFAGVIWINQYLLGFIPVILGRPWINYLLNIVISTVWWPFFLSK